MNPKVPPGCAPGSIYYGNVGIGRLTKQLSISFRVSKLLASRQNQAELDESRLE